MQELPRRLSHPCEAYPYGSFHCSLTRLVYVATTRSSTAACGHAYELVAYVAQLAVFHFSQRSQNSAVSELYTQKFPSWAVEGSGKWVDVEEVVSPVASSRSSLKSTSTLVPVSTGHRDRCRYRYALGSINYHEHDMQYGTHSTGSIAISDTIVSDPESMKKSRVSTNPRSLGARCRVRSSCARTTGGL